jgi:hypothetical protein
MNPLSLTGKCIAPNCAWVNLKTNNLQRVKNTPKLGAVARF